MTAVPIPLSRPRNDRLWPLDALRGAAVVGMTETHVYNVGASFSLLAAPWAPLWDALNGLVAPLFFVLTGFALQLRPARTAAAFGQRVRDVAIWWALAMLLHLPVINPEASRIDFSPWFHFDVLHALALSACVLILFQWGVGEDQRPRSLAGLSVGVVVLTALIDRLHVADALGLWFRGWVIHDAYSRFPLFPWSAFVFFGAWLAVLRKRLGLGKPVPWRAGLLCASIGGVALGLMHVPLGRDLTGDERANPLFTIARASAVTLSLFVTLGWQNRQPNALMKGLSWVGQRSLWLYVTHLFIFFTVALPGGSWAARSARQLSFPGMIGLTMVLLTLSIMACLARERCVAWFRVENPLGETPS